MRVGVGISEDITLGTQALLASRVEEAGFASLWTNEARGRDALLLCQAWAAATETLQVGVGVVPLWARTPAQLGMAAATLQEASGGRFLLGIGVSHPLTMESWHGAEFQEPLKAARELLQILNQLDHGGTSDVEGDVLTSRGFALEITPQPEPVRRYLAAMGPKMLALAGELADGVLLNWSSPKEIAYAGGLVQDSAREGGRGDVELATYVRVAVHEDRSVARAALVREFGRYAAMPAYARHFERQGFGSAAAEAASAYASASASALADLLDDEVLFSLGWYGTPGDDPAPVLNRYADAGLDHLIARVVVTSSDAVGSIDRTLAVMPPASS